MNFTDSYLKDLVSIERELRATADVNTLGVFSTQWRDRLIELRAYIITCQESLQSPEDTFSAKLKAYRDEFAASLGLARADAQAAAISAAPVLSIPIERN